MDANMTSRLPPAVVKMRFREKGRSSWRSLDLIKSVATEERGNIDEFGKFKKVS